jgi:hypothetical protein
MKPRWMIHAFFASGWMRARYTATGARLLKADQRYNLADAKFRTSVFEL